MPRLVPLDLPDWAADAYDVLGHRPALAILATLASDPHPISGGDLSQRTGLNAQALSVALRRLETAGIVSASAPRTERLGRTVTWHLNPDALDVLLARLHQGLTQAHQEAKREN